METGSRVHVGYTAQDGVARLRLHRPPANVLNLQALRELAQALDGASADESLKVLVLTAEGKHFSAGVDVADHTPERVGEMIPAFDQLCLRLSQLPFVTLALVQGHALGGGCELVACCDLALMARGARIGQPEIGAQVHDTRGQLGKFLDALHRAAVRQPQEQHITRLQLTRAYELVFGPSAQVGVGEVNKGTGVALARHLPHRHVRMVK